MDFWLPELPPSANRLWRQGNGRIYPSKEYSDWRHVMTLAAKQQVREMISDPYKLTITARRPNMRRDLDNIIKPLNDLIAKLGAVKNDNLCEMIIARWVSEGDGVAMRLERAGIE